MEEMQHGRTKWLTIRLSTKEEQKIQHFFSRTTARSLSEYARNVLLKDPVTIRYRNATADDFLEQMLQLKNELNAIGNNFNQSVHKLHMLDHASQIRHWAIDQELYRNNLFKKIDEIMAKADSIYTIWLQK